MKHALALMATLAAPQAQALSCMRPSPVATLQQAMADPDPWVVLLGTLAYDPADVPPGWDPANPDPPSYAPFAGMMTGNSLSAQGFDRAYAGPVLLQIDCAGPWCGGAPGQGLLLAFARVLDDGRYVIPLSPCGQYVFPPPPPDLMRVMVGCLAGGDCPDLGG